MSVIARIVVLAVVPACCCTGSRSTPTSDVHDRTISRHPDGRTPALATPQPDVRCKENHVGQDDLKLRENTNPKVSEHNVGIGSIIEADLPDENGVVAPRLSAVLAIYNPKTKESRRETVIVGSAFSIGPDRYCVVALEEGDDESGWVSLRKLTAP